MPAIEVADEQSTRLDVGKDEPNRMVLLQPALRTQGIQIWAPFEIPCRLIEIQCGTATRYEIERTDEVGRIDVAAVAIVQHDVHRRVAGREIDHYPVGIRTKYVQIRHS